MCEPQVEDGAQTTFPSRTPVALDFSATLSSSSFLRLLSVVLLYSSTVNLFVLSGNSDTSGLPKTLEQQQQPHLYQRCLAWAPPNYRTC